MAIELIVRAPGPPARDALSTVVARAKAADALAPVTVVVATNTVGVATRRFLGRSLGGVAGLDMVTVFRLAERLGAPALARAGRRPVSTAVLTAAVRAALRSDPGIFADIAEHPATERNIVRIHRELSELDPDQLVVLARQSQRSAAVVALHHVVRDRLGADWYGEHDLVDAAVASLRTDPQPAAALGTVVWHLPDRVSAGQGRLGQVIAEATPSVAVVALTGETDADHPVHVTLSHLGVTADPTAAPGSPRDGSPGSVRSVSVTDPDEEVRTALREILVQADRGIPLDRMALLFPREVPYQRLIHDQLTAAGIPFQSARGRPLATTALARQLLRFLALGDDDYARSAVLGILCHDPTGDRSAEWEAVSRAAGILSGAGEWTERLTAYAEACRLEDGPRARARAERRREAAVHATELGGAAGTLITDHERGTGLTSWSELAEWLTTAVEDQLAPDAQRASWPEPESAAAAQIVALVQRLAALDAIEPAASFLAFRRTIELELAERRMRHGRVGEGVLVGPFSAAVGVDLELAVVVGMAEGVVPATPTDDSVVPDHERASVGEALLRRADRARQQRRDFLVVLAEARQTVLVRPRSDLRRTLELPPSRWIPADATTADIDSFVAGVATTPMPATGQDWALQRLLHGADTPASAPRSGDPDADRLADPPLHRGAALVEARQSSAFTRFDGNLTHLDMPSPLEQTQSATRLEAWAICPHAYLMQHLLHVTPVEEPETIEELSALRSGSVFHEILDRFVTGHLDRPTGQPWPPSSYAEIQTLADRVFAEAEAEGGTGRPIHWTRYQARVRRELDEFVRRDSTRMATERTTPVATELPFGLSDDGQPALPVDLGHQRRLVVRGAIDRIDRTADGQLVVIDYKTGRPNQYKDLAETNPHDHGIHLQLPVYGLAAQRWAGSDGPVTVGYWFVTEKGGFRWIGYPLTTDALADALDAVDHIVSGIERGLFPARPQEPVSYQHFVPCDFCDPDGLGTKDGYQRWLTIKHTPELATYLDLIEPAELALDV